MPETTAPALSRRRAPAMSDVAKLAGVSHQTVSRVLNEPERVRPATKARVQQAIAELGYRRNTAARALVTRRTDAMGVVIPATTLHGPTLTLLGIEHTARRAGYWLSLASMQRIDAPTMRAVLEHFMEQGVDAIAVIAPIEAVLEAVEETAASLPLVTVTSANVRGRGLTAVTVDHVLGARLATEHLVSLGHQRVWHISGPADSFEAQERVRGFSQAMLAAGLGDSRVFLGDWSAQSGYEAASQMLALGRSTMPTAVFAGNDQMALGAIRAFSEAGMNVPEDLSVVGYDDLPDSGNYRPPLTTIHQDFEALGRRCVDALLAVMADSDRRDLAALSEPIAPWLVERSSTAPPGLRGAQETSHADH